ncbi:MAG: quinone oxidoreductase [Piscinibacter sp.]|uniref:quinone oxidoreductase family protein n=1 Tax=Piscinibacter sp. TaxID=1903157 RepID=UPI0025858DFB|nr:quinone oxidoreductase [Piscinibacter sp.]MCW5662669.1 quinone oxidoreductase [Piscinibacter sp.]
MTQTARVIRVAAFGGPENMTLDEVSVGEPGPGEIRIRHAASGINFIDVYHRSGVYPNPLPLALGAEGAGIVEAVGEGVTHLKPGDRAAYASNVPGSYSTLRVMPARTVVRLPESIDFDTGAAMMLKGLTVQYLLRKTLPVGGLQPGDFVLFHAAAGGVGLIACQWARALGLKLIGTAGSDDKCALALEHGASHAINYRSEDFVRRVDEITGGQKVKVVYDSVGKDTFARSLECLRPFGLAACFGASSGKPPAIELATLAKGSLYVTRPTLFSHIVSPETTQAMADELFAVVARGQVKIPVTRRYPLAEAAQAHRDLESRQTTGCMVLLP